MAYTKVRKIMHKRIIAPVEVIYTGNQGEAEHTPGQKSDTNQCKDTASESPPDNNLL
jgi:hypothetical protein